MTPKFPLWMTIVLALQTLGGLALALFLWMLGSMFDGILGMGEAVLIGIIVLLAPMCWWLARRQWQAGKHGLAKALAFAPILVIFLLNIIAALVMA